MDIYTYSQARQRLASLLDEAQSSGKVLIRRRDGSTFALVPERAEGSPLDVPSVKADISTKEIVATLRDQRARGRGGRRKA